MKKTFLTKTALIVTSIALAIAAVVPFAQASSGRDNDSNAIIYGGALTLGELEHEVRVGNDYGPNQSASELHDLYSTLGMDPKYFKDMVDGRIYKDGHVVVNGHTVASNVYTMGRHYLDGSTREEKIKAYKVYWRHPSVSFVSDSIPAFVYINADHKMAFGIVKSCGNPIKGEGVIIPKEKKYTLTIKKFNDKNNNKTKDAAEYMLPNWQFQVKGADTDKTFTTASDGSVTVPNLTKGKYTVTEVQKPGWVVTTGSLTQTVTVDADKTVWFGNRIVPVVPKTTYSIVAKKFEDIDCDKVHDADEPWIKDWHIKLQKSDNTANQEYLTNADGKVTFTGLYAGTYTVTEVMQSGWTNTTPVTQTIVLPDTKTLDGYVEFGNQKIKTPVTPSGEVESQTSAPLPTAGPIDAATGSFATVSLAGAGLYLRKSKLALLAAFKKF